MEQNENDILTLSEISQLLQDRKLVVVSALTGLSFPTLKSLTENRKRSYNNTTLRIISHYLTKDFK